MTPARIWGLLLAVIGLSWVSAGTVLQEPPSQPEVNLLKLLGITASPESLDYVTAKSQFQLHMLLTEQRHPKTWALSEKIATDTEAGLRMLFAVDEDIAARLDALTADTSVLEALAAGIESAILGRRKIYIYGCGATGRLAKQMESSFWRPFWTKVKAEADLWAKCRTALDPAVEDGLIGEMTGADRALISSLEGFEDLQLIGRLQLADRKIRKGDLVICITEGGETSSVIGTVLGALEAWKVEPGFDPRESRQKLFFVYNNPNDRLMPFDRSRKVLEADGITKINLATGPQAITGSTRMQATTIETFVVGNAIQTAVERVLRRRLSKKDMARLGFKDEGRLEDRLRKFSSVLQEVKKAVPAIAALTDLEAKTYADGRFSTYFASTGLITVFIDSTERSPTFRLYPLDTVREPAPKCWIQVWTDAADGPSAWRAFLGRPFRGLAAGLYKKPFQDEIEDPYLRTKAIESLAKAGDDQAQLYDFSFSEARRKTRGPKAGDLGVIAVLGKEAGELQRTESAFRRFADVWVKSGARLALILILDKPEKGAAGKGSAPSPAKGLPIRIVLEIESGADPFGVNRQIALKMLLNAHSTAVMAKLGKVVGNTMTGVSPTNLKLIGRATHLIQLHVNDVLSHPTWVRQNGVRKPITYGEANAVLFDSIVCIEDKAGEAGQAAEVPLSIIRILESLRWKRGLTADEALEIVRKPGLAAYLAALK